MAVTTKTVLVTGANTTDKVDCGSGATLDDLTASDMTWIGRIKRTSTGTNQFVCAKYDGTGGWYIQIATDYGEGTFLASTKCATSDAFAYTNASNLLSQDTWYDVAAVWTFSTRSWKLYRATLGTALAEISGYGTGGAGSTAAGVGAVGSDASANLQIGNLPLVPTNPFKGHTEWNAVFNKALTTAQMLTVQHGFDRNNAAMITNVGGCKGLWQTDNTTSVTDQSGNSNTGTVTGCSTTTGETILIPTVWCEAPSATDQTDYLYPGSHGKIRVTTDATSVIIGAYRLLSSYDNQNAISVEVNGAYDSQALVPAVGKAYVTRSLPAGSGKSISFINGVSSRTGAVGVSDGGISSGVVTMRFNAAVTELAPTTPTTNIVALNDSIIEGFNTNPVGQYGPLDLLRRYYAGTPQLLCDGYGGQSLYRIASDATARSNTATRVAGFNPTMILINLGTNDYTGNLWSAASFQTAAAALLVALNSACPNAVIRVVSPATLPSGEGANGSGSTLGDYRTAWSNACSGKAYVTYYNGPTALWDGTNADADNTHPNNTGAATIFNNLKTITAQPAQSGGSANSMGTPRVGGPTTHPHAQHIHQVVPGRIYSTTPNLATIVED